MNKWNELCYILFENLPSNTSEQLFELKIVQAFEKLGWSQFNNDIVVRGKVQLGAANSISPDLVLKSKQGTNLFIVEVKKPSIDIDNSIFKGQLSSYMGIMRVDIGLIIGSKIQIFLDGKYFNKNGIVLIDEIEFQRDNAKGSNFVQLFNKENYNKENIEKYAQEKAQQFKEIEDVQRLKRELLSEKYIEKIKENLRAEIIKEYDVGVTEKVFSELQIKIQYKNEIDVVESYPSRRTKKYNSVKNYNEAIGKLPIGKYVKKTFRELVKDNLIERKEIESLQRIDYSKETFDIQFPFSQRKFTTLRAGKILGKSISHQWRNLFCLFTMV